MVLHLALRRRARAVFLVAAALPPAAWSQSAPSAPRQTVVVTGNPLQRDDAGQPASVLAGDGLLVRRAGTLGETLDGLPGVASTWFGPNSSRPTIRGLDGDRVRLLDNGGASIDASSLSFDHAVALDPLVVERIEVLRGPAALLYGGNATGGVVNSIDNRIPRTALDGLGGRAELRLGGASAERSLAALLEGGAGAWAWHADAFGRTTSDLHVPRFVPREGGDALDASTRVRNSASEARGGAVGASWIGSAGFVGLSADTWRNDYGVTVEPDVTIRMQRDRVAAAGEWNLSGGPIRQWSFNAVRTNYEHQEVEGSGAVGTTFRSRGSDLRLQARHAPVGPLVGVVGLQVEQLRFSALGDEAFVPDTHTRSLALFALEEWQAGPATLSAGLRAERVQVDSAGDVADAAPRFGAPQSRRFTPLSASVGAQWALGDGVSLQASLGRTQRAPAYYELYASGLHVATAAFEQGDPTIGPETSGHVEIGAAWRRGHDSAKVQVFATRFSRFISLDATGREVDDGDGGTVPEYAFSAVRARLQGLEIESRWRLAEQPWQLSMTAGADLVRGTNVETGEPLPRLAPWRATLGLEASQGAWALGAHLRHAAAQARVPAGDEATPSSTLLNLWLTHKQRLGGAAATWYARLDNVSDALAYNASTIVTLRGLAPLPGRALSAGVRVEF